LLGQFILDEHTVFVYYDWDSNKIISWFNNTSFNKKRLIELNKHYEEKGVALMAYEVHNHSA